MTLLQLMALVFVTVVTAAVVKAAPPMIAVGLIALSCFTVGALCTRRR